MFKRQKRKISQGHIPFLPSSVNIVVGCDDYTFISINRYPCKNIVGITSRNIEHLLWCSIICVYKGQYWETSEQWYTQRADRGPESGPPKGSEWTAEDRQLVLTKRKSGVRVDPGSMDFFNLDPRTKRLSTPASLEAF